MTYLDQYSSLAEHNRRSNRRAGVRAASISSTGTGSRPNSRPTSGNEGHSDSITSHHRSRDSTGGRDSLTHRDRELRDRTKKNKDGAGNKNKNVDAAGNNLSFDNNNCIFSSKEAKSTYVVLVMSLHFILLSVPFITTAVAWTLTNVVHSVTMYYILHHCKGSPFSRHDQGKFRRYTYWEQIDTDSEGFFTPTKNFFIVVPVLLFILAQFYSMLWHTAINILALAVAIIPKLPAFHKFRLLKINKY